VNIISKHIGAFVSSWQEVTNSSTIQVETCICSHSQTAISTSWSLWNWYTLRYYLCGPNRFLHFCHVHIHLDAVGQPVRSSSWMSVSPFSRSLHHFLTCGPLVTSLSYTCIILWWSMVHTLETNHSTNIFMGQSFICFGYCVSVCVMSTISLTDWLATPVACYTYCKFCLLQKPGCW